MIKYLTISDKELHNKIFMKHLNEINYLKHLQKDSDFIKNLFVIIAVDDEKVVGHISLIKQTLKLLKLPLEKSEDIVLNDSPLWEMFVQTFFVDSNYRNQGIGTDLQSKALEFTKISHCYQLRSWSTTDKVSNYSIKFKLGFSFAPAIITTQKGEKILGGYFVKRV